jgi:CRP/FNR family cyclic AMP-dependent transcriptional regulator
MKSQPLDALLAGHAFFRGLDAPDLALLAGCAENARFEKDQLLFRAGDPANHFFVVRQGRLSLELQPPGGEVVVFGTAGEGEVLGWSWLIPPFRWQTDSRALELTRVLRFDGACLRRKCDADPRLGYELMKRFTAVLAQRFHETQTQLLDMYATRA